jgi:hypothetical protein
VTIVSLKACLNVGLCGVTWEGAGLVIIIVVAPLIVCRGLVYAMAGRFAAKTLRALASAMSSNTLGY